MVDTAQVRVMRWCVLIRCVRVSMSVCVFQCEVIERVYVCCSYSVTVVTV
jgi:hypothetical protein